MTTIALSCGNIDRATRPDTGGVRWVDLPATPDRADVDPLLAETSERLVVHGTDADLAAVVVRLLRKNRLQELTVGYVPATTSPASRLWGIPAGAFSLALQGRARPAPLIRDDNGGVLVASGVIEPITGQAYCDDQRILNGPALGLEVSPDPDAEPLPEPTADPIATEPAPVMDGLRATVVRRWLLLRQSRESAYGRATQVSFQEARVVSDGVAHPRPMRKWAWYRHTQDLLLVRP
ncbi:hypothetical protein DFQ14_101437 [Halopolyspora algeriensis]|uniref:Uncharacterized protein n=1 Tax=Halopolyspora algeriensis TaxID=1500506 RepID=A0A368W334_9ACTN|nr:hypothetical protein [Halopolyspora algeriensis]RCW47093.1 hypothetical protein DFQ14_101437 [Halopolyspora algeriensis]TQM48180.1 hypothetical protein FHU43_3142 [Halopolyspora algeriensis]